MKQNHIWVVEELNKKGEWRPLHLVDNTKKGTKGTIMLLSPHFKGRRFRPKKYTTPRGYA